MASTVQGAPSKEANKKNTKRRTLDRVASSGERAKQIGGQDPGRATEWTKEMEAREAAQAEANRTGGTKDVRPGSGEENLIGDAPRSVGTRLTTSGREAWRGGNISAGVANIKNRKENREDIKAELRLNNASLGGSQEKERLLLQEAYGAQGDAYNRMQAGQSSLNLAEGFGAERAALADQTLAADQARTQDAIARQQASVLGIGAGAGQASNILGQAYGANQLTGTAENILNQRAAAMAAAPSYAQLANEAIAAQTQGMQDQTRFAQGQLGRRAMGMAAGMGEGGALAAQQAMASLIGGGADMAAQSQLQNAAAAAQMRAEAAANQRGETVGEAGYASQARLGAAQQERANQLATAGQQSQLAYNAGLATNAAQAGLTGAQQAATNTSASQAQQASGLYGTLAAQQSSQGLQALGQANEYATTLLGQKLGMAPEKNKNVRSSQYRDPNLGQ